MSLATSTLHQQVLARATDIEALDLDARDVAAVDALTELETLKNTIAAAQARLAVSLKQTRVAKRAHQPAATRERGIGAEVALARRESPHRGGIHLGLAAVLCAELPHTLAAMEAGWCTEWQATQIAQGTACLTLADRQRIDTDLMADPATTDGWGIRRFRAEIDRRAYALDPHAALDRHRQAADQRHTSIRPAPDGMARLSALVPLAEGIAVHATLSRAADRARAAGDPRTRGQVMADTLVDSVLSQVGADSAGVSTGSTNGGVSTGSTNEDGSTNGGVSTGSTDEDGSTNTHEPAVTVHVTVSDATLLNLPGPAGDEPGWICGPGVAGIPLPAQACRDLVARAHAQGLAALRRLYVRPHDGHLVAMDSRARTFPAGLAAYLHARDRTCRTPWCDAPVRHLDHVEPHAEGGPTTATNGQGLCEACNHHKQATDWHQTVQALTDLLEAHEPVHEVETTTPTGHRHRSRAPAAPSPFHRPRSTGIDIIWAPAA